MNSYSYSTEIETFHTSIRVYVPVVSNLQLHTVIYQCVKTKWGCLQMQNHFNRKYFFICKFAMRHAKRCNEL